MTDAELQELRRLNLKWGQRPANARLGEFERALRRHASELIEGMVGIHHVLTCSCSGATLTRHVHGVMLRTDSDGPLLGCKCPTCSCPEMSEIE